MESLENEDYDIIVSDYQMPDMDGLRFLETVREEKEIDIPFIMFTGKGREEVAMEALNLGAERYLKKGGDPKSQYAVLADAIEQEWELYRKNKELKRSEKEKSLILENTNEIIAYHDKDHNIKWANEAYREETELSPDELKGQKCYHAWGLDDLCEGCPVTKSIEEGESIEAELFPEEQEGWTEDQGSWLIDASPVKDENGEVIGAVEVAVDVTERRETEKKLKESKKKYETLFKETPLGVFVYDENGVITDCNDKFVEAIGSSREKLIGFDMINDLKDKEVIEEVKKSLEEGNGYYEGEYSAVTVDNTIPVRAIFKGIEDDQGEIYSGIGLIEDISERKEAKEAIKKSEERYRRLFETAQDGMLILDALSGEIMDANPFIRDLTGYSLDELKGRKLWEIGTFRDIAENKEKFDKLREEEYVRYEHLPLKTKNGIEKSVEFVSNLYDVAGKKVIQCNIRDVSERKEAEEREEFLHSLLRHNLQNKSQVILGYLQMLEDLELSEGMEEYIDKAKDVTKEGINVIKKVRKLRKIDEKSEFRLVNIDSILDDVISNYQGQLEDKGIEIETEKCEDMVKGGALLEELFSNIIENAIKHSNSDKISIKVEAKEEECIITIEDDGRGIPDDKKDRIFEKGFKEGEQAGTGLGMYMAKKIVENYEGDIEVEDSDLGGARFEVRLKKE